MPFEVRQHKIDFKAIDFMISISIHIHHSNLYIYIYSLYNNTYIVILQ